MEEDSEDEFFPEEPDWEQFGFEDVGSAFPGEETLVVDEVFPGRDFPVVETVYPGSR